MLRDKLEARRRDSLDDGPDGVAGRRARSRRRARRLARVSSDASVRSVRNKPTHSPAVLGELADEPLDRGKVGHRDGAAVDLGVAFDQLGLRRRVQREAWIPAQVVGLAGVGHHRQPELTVGEVGLQPAQPRRAVAPERGEDRVDVRSDPRLDRRRPAPVPALRTLPTTPRNAVWQGRIRAWQSVCRRVICTPSSVWRRRRRRRRSRPRSGPGPASCTPTPIPGRRRHRCRRAVQAGRAPRTACCRIRPSVPATTPAAAPRHRAGAGAPGRACGHRHRRGDPQPPQPMLFGMDDDPPAGPLGPRCRHRLPRAGVRGRWVGARRPDTGAGDQTARNITLWIVAAKLLVGGVLAVCSSALRGSGIPCAKSAATVNLRSLQESAALMGGGDEGGLLRSSTDRQRHSAGPEAGSGPEPAEAPGADHLQRPDAGHAARRARRRRSSPPRCRRSPATSAASTNSSWVVTAYLLTQTIATPLFGKLGDLYGRKRLFQIAIVIFVIGSVLSGLRIVDGPAHRVPRAAGRRCRRAHGDRAGDHRRRRQPARARSLPGLLRRSVRLGERDRPARRWLHHRSISRGAGSSS